MRPSVRGYSVLEAVVALAIFSLFILILTALQAQKSRFEQSLRIEFMRHPEKIAVLARVRKDVVDSRGYPKKHESFSQSPTTLLLCADAACKQIVVWDFRNSAGVRRLEYGPEGLLAEWLARGQPRYRISSFKMQDESVAVRLQAFDRQEDVAFDQIITPRSE